MDILHQQATGLVTVCRRISSESVELTKFDVVERSGRGSYPSVYFTHAEDRLSGFVLTPIRKIQFIEGLIQRSDWSPKVPKEVKDRLDHHGAEVVA